MSFIFKSLLHELILRLNSKYNGILCLYLLSAYILHLQQFDLISLANAPILWFLNSIFLSLHYLVLSLQSISLRFFRLLSNVKIMFRSAFSKLIANLSCFSYLGIKVCYLILSCSSSFKSVLLIECNSNGSKSSPLGMP